MQGTNLKGRRITVLGTGVAVGLAAGTIAGFPTLASSGYAAGPIWTAAFLLCGFAILGAWFASMFLIEADPQAALAGRPTGHTDVAADRPAETAAEFPAGSAPTPTR